MESLSYTAKLGDFVFIPRGNYHRFINKSERLARQLLIFTPGGFDRFFIEAGKTPVEDENIPSFAPRDNNKAKAIAGKYGSIQGVNCIKND